MIPKRSGDDIRVIGTNLVADHDGISAGLYDVDLCFRKLSLTQLMALEQAMKFADLVI